jgi:hypothetical protein
MQGNGRRLPGAELIDQGMCDLAAGIWSLEALLVSIGAPRLTRLGLQIPDPVPAPERKLYQRLAETDADAAHAKYNALVRRLVSFERAMECGR